MSDDREHRNAVFAAHAQAASQQSAVPAQSAQERARNDFGFEIPTVTIPLPSNGKIYSHPSLRDAELIDIRAMTAREEDILTSRALLKKGTVITELIKSCLIDKTIDPLDLTTGDRSALMVSIRITGYGELYEADVECGECGVKSSQEFDLSKLPIKRLTIDPAVQNANVFEMQLPLTGKTVKFKFLTGRDEEEILANIERSKKLHISTDASITTNLLYSILSIDTVTERSKISNFVKIMPARDSLALRSFIKDNEPGIDMRQEVTCPSCGAQEVVSMPIGTQFLWPSTK